MFGAQADALHLIASLTLWSAAKQFTNLLHISHFHKNISDNKLINSKHLQPFANQKGYRVISCSWAAIQSKYESLKTLADMINSVHGLNLTCFLIVSVLEYAIGLEVFIGGNQTAGGRVVSLFYIVEKCFIVFVAADVCRLVS